MLWHWLVGAFVAATAAWRVSIHIASPPEDLAQIRRRYGLRGERVTDIRHRGTSYRTGRGFPIRTCDVDVEGDVGRRTTTIGIDALAFGEPKMWRCDREGRRLPLF